MEHVDALHTTDPKILRYKGEALFFRAYQYFKLLNRFGDVPLVTHSLDIDSPELFMERTPRKEVEDAILQDLYDASLLLPKKSEMAVAETGRITSGAAVAFRARVALYAGTWAINHKHRSDGLALLGIAKECARQLIFDKPEYDLILRSVYVRIHTVNCFWKMVIIRASLFLIISMLRT